MNLTAVVLFLVLSGSALNTVGQTGGTRATQEKRSAIVVTTDKIKLLVDTSSLRWSASLTGTNFQINDVYFIDDPFGWNTHLSVNQTDKTKLGDFATVTLTGSRNGDLDFRYDISISKHGTDIVVSHGRSNHTGQAASLNNLDYFVSSDVRLGGTSDQWRLLGTRSQLAQYYDFDRVSALITPKLYEVNAVVKNMSSGVGVLFGHITTQKGLSRFEISNGFDGEIPDRMQVRGYCSYKVSVPDGASFEGEKLLIQFTTDPIQAMEHQADLIATVNDIRLKEKRPIDLSDKEMVANDFCHFAQWMSGGSVENAKSFFAEHQLTDFYYGLGGPYCENWGHYNLGAKGTFGPKTDYPKECYINSGISSEWFTDNNSRRLIDFSNPLTVKYEHDRIFNGVKGHEKETGWLHLDFAHAWDKFPGQHDPFKSAVETWHAGAAAWRDVVDQKAPRLRNRACFAPLDHSYGYIDIHRVSGDADGGYEEGIGWANWFTEAMKGASNRFFYNGRVYWNDCDAFHVYKFSREYGQSGEYNYGEAKVSANFHAIAGNVMTISEAFDQDGNKLQTYPANRIELMKRVSPPTMDVAYPVDLFERRPAEVWNMPVERPFGKWNVLAVFNHTSRYAFYADNWQFQVTLDAAKDLRLDSTKEYIVYEFWTKKLLGVFKKQFTSQVVKPYDCDIYSVVEKKDYPVLISTSRHVRQMAVDILDLSFDKSSNTLVGKSRSVANDPYELRIYIPAGFVFKTVTLSEKIPVTTKVENSLLTINYVTRRDGDVSWKVSFTPKRKE